MDTNWSAFCAVCASHDVGGELRIRGELGATEHLRLCTACFGFLADALRVAAAEGSDCSLCGDGRGVHAVALLPAAASNPGNRPPAGYLLCHACLTWTRDLIDGESLTRWARRSEGDGPAGEWPHARIAGICAVGLNATDTPAIAAAAEAVGAPFSTHGTAPAASSVNERAIYLVRAAPDRSATAFVASLPPERRHQVAVVCAPGQEDDAAAALVQGAAETLAAPLSRQQVLGAIDRIDRDGAPRRDPRTGLPWYPVVSRFGLPCYGLRVESPATAFETVLLLWRFLRGYDAVGGDGEGNALVLVYCDPDELDAVLRRFGRLLGESATVNVVAYAEAAAEGQPDAPRRRLPQAAAAYFGTAYTRAS